MAFRVRPLHPGQSLLDRMVSAVEKVRQRLMRAAAALEAAGVPYAVVGDNAVAAWVATVDESAIRNTQDVDILLRRGDLPFATRSLEAIGFIRQNVSGIEIFLDGPEARSRDAVRIVLAGEKLRLEDVFEAPDVDDCVRLDRFRVLSLASLVKLELMSWRCQNQVNLRDMLDVGLIDALWVSRLPADLGVRLQQMIDSPEG